MTFDDIIDSLSEFPDLPKKKAKKWILEAIQKICRESFAYSEILTFLTTAGQAEYTLTPSDSDTKVIGIFEDGVEFSTVDTPSPSASDGTDAGTLTPSQSYSYKVTATADDYGETLPSTAVSHTCPASGSITLSWDAVEEADGYKIYRDNSGTYELLEETTDTSYTDDGSDSLDSSTTAPTKGNLVKRIHLSNETRENAIDRYWKSRESDSITRIVWDGDTTIRLNRIPETSNMGFQIKVALYPTAEIAIPSILETWNETIEDYVRGKIYLHPKTKTMVWFDSELAAYYMGKFRAELSNLKGQVMFGFGGKSKIKPQFFA